MKNHLDLRENDRLLGLYSGFMWFYGIYKEENFYLYGKFP